MLAGVIGAGKSSIPGSALTDAGLSWYNPDDMARQLQQEFPLMPLGEVNSAAWHEGVARLSHAIGEDEDYNFETTLGGRTITNLLLDAMALGLDVRLWYCGLATPELHIERVAARVARGGHDIPEDLIRARIKRSMSNLCRLAPGLKRLDVIDNSQPLDAEGQPALERLLRMQDGALVQLADPMPDWAKPIATVCLLQHRKRRG
ncbi:MAG: hypothetical protein AAGH19_02735 [Pseudomonadota bacterium]